MKSQKTILVTGGASVFGKAISNYMISLNHKVIRGTRHILKDSDSVQLDVTKPEQVAEIIQTIEPDIIIHLAATYSADFDEVYAVNVNGAKNVLTSLQKAGFHSRVVLIGSAAEYGIVKPEENPIGEARALRPVSSYGLTKSWQTLLGIFCAHQGQDVVIARIFNLDGSGLTNRLFVGRVDNQIQEIRAGQRKKIEVGSLSAVRDYISLEEAVQQLYAIMDYGLSGRVYHIASGQPIKMRDLLAKRLLLYGLDESIVEEDQNLSTRTGYDVPMIYADIRDTRKLLQKKKNDPY